MKESEGNKKASTENETLEDRGRSNTFEFPMVNIPPLSEIERITTFRKRLPGSFKVVKIKYDPQQPCIISFKVGNSDWKDKEIPEETSAGYLICAENSLVFTINIARELKEMKFFERYSFLIFRALRYFANPYEQPALPDVNGGGKDKVPKEEADKRLQPVADQILPEDELEKLRRNREKKQISPKEFRRARVVAMPPKPSHSDNGQPSDNVGKGSIEEGTRDTGGGIEL